MAQTPARHELTCQALREYRDRVRLELQVLGSEKLQLVQHFIGHDSQFFSKALMAQAGKTRGRSMADAGNWLAETDHLLKELLRNNIRMQDAMIFIDASRQVSLEDEIGKITSFPAYADLASAELTGSIRKALALLQYAVAARQVAEAVRRLRLVPAEDPGLRRMEEDQTQSVRPLKEANQEYAHLVQLFRCEQGSLEDIHFALAAKFAECMPVIDFFREVEYASAAGQERFEQTKASLTVQLRGQVEETILNEVIEISSLVGPFLSPCGSLQQWVQQLLVGLPAVLPRHLEVIARVNESLGLVVGWFSRYQGKALESAIATAQALQDTGRLEVSLAQSSFSARIRYQAAGFKSTTHLSEAEARELVRQLAFYSRGQSDPNASVKVAVSCRDLCRKAMNVVSKLRTLRSKGHPQYQCCQVLVPLSSIPELDAEAEGLQQQCQDWERLWRQKRRDHPLLAFFDSHELFSMVVLCSGHPLRRNVIEAMRNVQWPKEEEEEKKNCWSSCRRSASQASCTACKRRPSRPSWRSEAQRSIAFGAAEGDGGWPAAGVGQSRRGCGPQVGGQALRAPRGCEPRCEQLSHGTVPAGSQLPEPHRVLLWAVCPALPRRFASHSLGGLPPALREFARRHLRDPRGQPAVGLAAASCPELPAPVEPRGSSRAGGVRLFGCRATASRLHQNLVPLASF
ncbi:unnamed protein product [Effrenium voratum]|nr:unnamed protein product [Effrenium voratum]